MDDDTIRAVVRRLARPHPSGGDVIESTVIIAEGTDSGEIVAWIAAHAGIPDSTRAAAPMRGLHGARPGDAVGSNSRTPLRYVLPPGALS
jgi:hypothetical protein